MQRFKFSRIIWSIAMLLAFVEVGHAQTWSAWQALNDGVSNRLQIRTMATPDTMMESGYKTKYEILNQYASPVKFTINFPLSVTNPGTQVVTNYTESVHYHVASNTSCLGRLDTQTLNMAGVTISSFTIHSSDPNPLSEEATHQATATQTDSTSTPAP